MSLSSLFRFDLVLVFYQSWILGDYVETTGYCFPVPPGYAYDFGPTELVSMSLEYAWFPGSEVFFRTPSICISIG